MIDVAGLAIVPDFSGCVASGTGCLHNRFQSCTRTRGRCTAVIKLMTFCTGHLGPEQIQMRTMIEARVRCRASQLHVPIDGLRPLGWA